VIAPEEKLSATVTPEWADQVRRPKYIWLAKLATQFKLTKRLIGENIFLGKEAQIWIRNQWEFWKV
jgi:hypothetical protein